ncbi:MAG TPA: hypothetical protein VMF31_07945 [Solirubrobacterales bacterium]|nr:hypothetical protein [Solirubrobacterales bacterium]
MIAKLIIGINAHGRPIIVGLVGLVMLAGCNSSTAQTSSVNPITSPGTFKDDFDAKLAAHGDGLWLAKSGLDQDDNVRLQVLKYQDETWVALPGLPKSTTDTGLVLAARSRSGNGAEPCVGDTAPNGNNRVRCFGQKGWQPTRIPASYRDLWLNGLERRGRKLIALFRKDGRKGTKTWTVIHLAKLQGNRFVRFGSPLRINTQLVAGLGQVTVGTKLDGIEVGITTTTSPSRRWVATIKGGSWSRSSEVPDLVGGDLYSAPVRANSATYFPVNESQYGVDRNWEQSLFRIGGRGDWSQVGGAPVNEGFGKAQGGADAVGKRVWVTWGELNTDDAGWGGYFPTTEYAARVDETGTGFDQRIQLWRGKTVFPGPQQAIAYQGDPVFLYMRQFSRKGGMHATVDFSHR